MKRFDVFEVNSSKKEIVVNLQSDLHGNHLNSLIVAPLTPHNYYHNREINRLFVPVELGSGEYNIIMPQLAMISKKRIGKTLGSLDSYHRDITDALDFLFQGF